MMYEVKRANGLMTDKDKEKETQHNSSKLKTRARRKIDLSLTDANKPVISYDLENVFSLPRTNVSSAYYKCKLNVYNPTAIVGKTKKGYCSLWSEDKSGRSGNDIASAMISNLQRIVKDHPEASELIIWCDSCVPQNRNSNMSYAVQYLLQNTPSITSITHRFCEPGHSSIQDIDNLHSLIEQNLKDVEIHSPIALFRLLKSMKVNGLHTDVKIPDAGIL